MYRFLLPIILPMLAIFVACDSGNPNFTILDDDLTPTTKRDSVERTVLVYMIADNSLGTRYESDKADLDEMLEGIKQDTIGNCRLLVYYNRPNTNLGNAPQMLEITADGRQVLKTYPDDPDIYSVEPTRIREVMSDMKSLAPARDYGLVLWSHANGWITPLTDVANLSRAFGEDRGYQISIQSLAETLKDERFSFVYFDCCLMGNIETIYEMRHIAPVMVACPTELSIDGMPYDQNVPVMFDLTLTPEEAMVKAATNTFQYYYDNVNGYDDGCQIAVYRTDVLDDFADATRAIYSTLTEINSDAAQIQRYNKPLEVTHYTFDMQNLMELYAYKDYPDLYADWNHQWERFVAYGAATRNGIGGLVIRRYCGLGTYVIDEESDIVWRGYDTLRWWNDVVSHSPAYQGVVSR